MDQGTRRLIKRHNAQMRDLIVRDIDALEEKLNVKRQVATKVDDAMDTVKGKLGMNQDTTTGSWGSFARGNALPLAAVSLGGVVLARNLQARTAAGSAQHPGVNVTTYAGSPETGLRAGGQDIDGSSSVGDKALEAKDAVAERAVDAKDAIVDKATAATDKVSEQASHAKEVIIERIPSREQATVLAKDHGPALGLAALAVGAAAGAFMPRTRAEEVRLAPLQSQVREKASELVDRGKELAQDKVEVAQEAIVAGVETAKETLDDAQQSDGGDEPPLGSSDTPELPDLTQPNRITSSRNGVAEPFSAGPSTS